jgi:hypothetical protein
MLSAFNTTRSGDRAPVVSTEKTKRSSWMRDTLVRHRAAKKGHRRRVNEKKNTFGRTLTKSGT